MEIRRSTTSDTDIILNIYAQARDFMASNGNANQWGNNYPETSLVEQDMKDRNSYVCVDNGEIVGVFFYTEEIDSTYIHIYEGEWLNNKPYGVVHRVASINGKRGVATFCLNWCFEKCKNLKIDTHRDNVPMQNLLSKNGFVSCGVIYLDNGAERIAFQKSN
ncbi:MAG: GNAT family N-acetyltransferase [Lachnotalea sp.]